MDSSLLLLDDVLSVCTHHRIMLVWLSFEFLSLLSSGDWGGDREIGHRKRAGNGDIHGIPKC